MDPNQNNNNSFSGSDPTVPPANPAPSDNPTPAPAFPSSPPPAYPDFSAAPAPAPAPDLSQAPAQAPAPTPVPAQPDPGPSWSQPAPGAGSTFFGAPADLPSMPAAPVSSPSLDFPPPPQPPAPILEPEPLPISTAPSGSMGGSSDGFDPAGLEPQGAPQATPGGLTSDLGQVEPAAPAEPVPTFTPPPAFGETTSQLAGDGSGFGAPAAFGAPVPAPDAATSPLQPEAPAAPAMETPSGLPSWSTDTADSSFSGGTSEAVPTDLSHLVGSSDTSASSPPSPEGLIPPVTPVPDATVAGQPADASQVAAAQAVTSGASGGFPKWMLLVGLMVLLLVMGASAYFILGVGQAPTEQTSIPAEQPPLTNPPRTIIPSPPAPPEQPSTSSAASFGNLGGVTPPPSSPSGTSALDLLRQRQGR